jgi:hypothetical protein
VGKRIGDPAAEGRRKQQAAGKIHGRVAWIGTGREGGGSEMHAAGKRCSSAAQQLHTQLTAGVGVRTEERKSGGEVYKRNPNGPSPNKYSPIN